jgi:hypothetical protein
MNARITTTTASLPGSAAVEILVTGAQLLAHGDDLEPTLQGLVDTVARLGVSSAAIVIAGADGALEIAASLGLDVPAAAGLTAAIASPGHPVARTMHETRPTFDVLPVNPGGPALRSHLPLVVTRGGTDSVLGVLALAHDAPIELEMRRVLQAVADLAAVALEWVGR